MKIVCISGAARHGKDATASIMKHHFEKQGNKVLVIRYGDYLKDLCTRHFGWNGEKDEAGRTILQVYGTEKARDNYPDVWVDVVIATLKAFGKEYDYILIPDTRYPNEVSKLKVVGMNVFSIWVHRKNFDNGLSPEQKKHRSETSMLDFPFNSVVSVESDISKLKDAVEQVINQYNL